MNYYVWTVSLEDEDGHPYSDLLTIVARDLKEAESKLKGYYPRLIGWELSEIGNYKNKVV